MLRQQKRHRCMVKKPNGHTTTGKNTKIKNYVNKPQIGKSRTVD